MTARGFPLDPPVDTVGDGNEFAGFVRTCDAFGSEVYQTRGGFPSIGAARAWAKSAAAGPRVAEAYTGAYRVLRAEHR